jgi:hypothetical protein
MTSSKAPTLLSQTWACSGRVSVTTVVRGYTRAGAPGPAPKVGATSVGENVVSTCTFSLARAVGNPSAGSESKSRMTYAWSGTTLPDWLRPFHVQVWTPAGCMPRSTRLLVTRLEAGPIVRRTCARSASL